MAPVPATNAAVTTPIYTDLTYSLRFDILEPFCTDRRGAHSHHHSHPTAGPVDGRNVRSPTPIDRIRVAWG